MAETKNATGSPENGAMRIDAALVQELAELLTANALTEIEVEDGERKIRVARHAAAPVAAPPTTAASPAATAALAATQAEEVSGETIKSPMVGTAFLSAEPGARPFAEV